MKNWMRIVRLTTVVFLLTIGLFAFTLINKDKLEAPEMLGCATVDIIDDPKYYQPFLDHPGFEVFNDNCKACHRLDQKLIGPALRNSFASRDSIWLIKMIVSSNDLIKSGDTLAIQLFNEYNRSEQPDFKSLSKQELSDLIEYLKLEGKRDLTIP